MYYYKHVNGTIIKKPDIVVQDPYEYFDSPFVVKWWYESENKNKIKKDKEYKK